MGTERWSVAGAFQTPSHLSLRIIEQAGRKTVDRRRLVYIDEILLHQPMRKQLFLIHLSFKTFPIPFHDSVIVPSTSESCFLTKKCSKCLQRRCKFPVFFLVFWWASQCTQNYRFLVDLNSYIFFRFCRRLFLPYEYYFLGSFGSVQYHQFPEIFSPRNSQNEIVFNWDTR